MKVRMIFMQDDDVTWLETAMGENALSGWFHWEPLVNQFRMKAAKRGCEMRILEVEVPGVYEAFEVSKVQATTKVVGS